MLEKPRPGVRTRKNLLLTAMAPMGTTLYIYGGGWDREDSGASREARTIGLSPYWKEFFEEQNEDFCYRDDSNPGASYYPYDGLNRYSHLGLDCSGYMGWVMYNVLHHQSGRPGLVVKSSEGARLFARGLGLGTWSRKTDQQGFLDIRRCRPGDIVSMDGHIWMYVGKCEDGSVLIAHSSVIKSRSGKDGGGVQLSVLNPPKLKNIESRAYVLADHFMKEHFPEWYCRYPVAVKLWEEYVKLYDKKETGLFCWKEEVLSDPEGMGEMKGELLLSEIAGLRIG